MKDRVLKNNSNDCGNKNCNECYENELKEQKNNDISISNIWEQIKDVQKQLQKELIHLITNDFENVLNILGDKFTRLAEFENFMEQNDFKSLEELKKELGRNFFTTFNEVSNAYSEIENNKKDIIKIISALQTEKYELQQSRDTWKKACEHSIKHFFNFFAIIASFEKDEMNKAISHNIDYFYQQAQEELKGEKK